MCAQEIDWSVRDPAGELLAALGLARGGSAAAARQLTLALPEGPWDIERIPAARRTSLGVLVLDGIVARHLTLAGSEAMELLGEGDVINPWTADPQAGFLPASTHWSIVSPARLLIVDRALVSRISGRRDVLEALSAGAAERAARQALHQAIAQLPRVELRLLALFWHLATRWGRIGPEGVVLPLPFSHATLGRLVGARRPTVSLALGELAERGYVRRRENGSWQLEAEAPAMLEDQQRRASRRRRAAPQPADALDRTAAELFSHVTRLRENAGAQRASRSQHTSRQQALRERSAQVREESARLRAELAQRRADRAPVD
jgi:CRP-like cAMP-binding protein